METSTNTVPPPTRVLVATVVRQNRFEFMTGRIRASLLCEISSYDRIRLESISSKRYIGIQRPLNDDRVERLAEFVLTEDGILPGTVVMSLSSEFVQDIKDGPNGETLVTFTPGKGAAAIIDGQHRVAGLQRAKEIQDENYEKEAAAAEMEGKEPPARRHILDEFDVPIVVFIDLDPADQAFIFNRINANQKPVDRSLSFELFGSARFRSPQKSAHEVAQILNTQADSPFQGRLKMVVGLKDEWTRGGTLTQATFANELIKLYSADKVEDEVILLSRKQPPPDSTLPLRELWRTEQEAAIIRIVKAYYNVISQTWPVQWENTFREFNLSKSTGYAAWMRVLGDWLKTKDEGPALLREDFSAFKKRISPLEEEYNKVDKQFTSRNYPSNSAGQDGLRDQLLADLGLPERAKRRFR